MNHSGKIRRNHEFSSLKLRNHELRESVKGIMNNEANIPSAFQKEANVNELLKYCCAFDRLEMISFPDLFG